MCQTFMDDGKLIVFQSYKGFTTIVQCYEELFRNNFFVLYDFVKIVWCQDKITHLTYYVEFEAGTFMVGVSHAHLSISTIK